MSLTSVDSAATEVIEGGSHHGKHSGSAVKHRADSMSLSSSHNGKHDEGNDFNYFVSQGGGSKGDNMKIHKTPARCLTAAGRAYSENLNAFLEYERDHYDGASVLLPW